MSRVLSILFLLLASSFGAFAQMLTIAVQDENGTPLANAEASLINTHCKEYTSKKGTAVLKCAEGKYTLFVFAQGYKSFMQDVSIKESSNDNLKIVLAPLAINLEVAQVQAEQERRELQRLRSIEGAAIYRGMKNEVISPNENLANVSTNNSRQVYNKVAGLNIWENDGAGIQLGIGARGLSPNRTSHFNVRQNMYDISADPLGYPESYYTPPLEGVDRIVLVRGAAALQYGPQFGGLLNFNMKKGNPDKALEVITRQTIGSYGLNDSITNPISSSNTFVSLGGSKGNWNYYGFYQYKTGAGWRPNSDYDVHTGYLRSIWTPVEKMTVDADVTIMQYLAQQPGGLIDAHFEANPRQSIRDRNWFRVDWKLMSIGLNYDFSTKTVLSSKFFGLMASRKALGFLGQASRIDPMQNRDLISGDFNNWGNETRFLHKIDWKDRIWVLAAGVRYFHGTSIARQGSADETNEANFDYVSGDYIDGSQYTFPNQNLAFYTQEILPITKHLSLTPGIRMECIQTEAEGDYRQALYDLAGNIIEDTLIHATDSRTRTFFLGGVGANFRLNENWEIYGNWNQNYRAINFTDIQIKNAGTVVDPDIHDERGYSADIGIRGNWKDHVKLDVSAFLLKYNDRIGSYYTTIPDPVVIQKAVRLRTNISDARNIGVEAIVETELLHFVGIDITDKRLSWFVNASFIDGRYTDSEVSAFYQKKVELIPAFSCKSGLEFRYKWMGIGVQYTYTGEQYSDATNAEQTPNAVDGIIPAYHLTDLSLQATIKRVDLALNINNITNQFYYTRRAAGYPGPGIIPADGRGIYLSVQVKI